MCRMMVMYLCGVTLVLSACSFSAYSQSILNQDFSQLDFQSFDSDPLLTTFTLNETTNSEWGQYTIQVETSTDLTFLNIALDDGSQNWFVRNLPIPPTSLLEPLATDVTLKTSFDLGLLGYARGDQASGDSFDFVTNISTDPIEYIGSTILDDYISRVWTAGSKLIGSDWINAAGRGDPRGDPGSPIANLFGFDFGGFIELDLRWLWGMPNVEQGPNQCGPGAATNSLQWLNQKYGNELAPLDDNLEDRLAKLAVDMNTSTRTGTSDANFIDGKLKYVDDRADLDLDIKFMSDTLGGDDRNVGDTTADARGLKPTLDFILDEINAGEDVEIGISFRTPAEPFTDTNNNGQWDAGEPYVDTDGDGNYDVEKTDGGHWVTAAGKVKIGDYAGIWFVEDQKQGEYYVDSNGNGKWDPGEPFRNTDGSPNEIEVGDSYWDSNGNNQWDPGEPFTDTDGDGTYDPKNGGTDKIGFSRIKMREDGYLSMIDYPTLNRIEIVVSESVIPEPSSAVMCIGLALAGLMTCRRRGRMSA